MKPLFIPAVLVKCSMLICLSLISFIGKAQITENYEKALITFNQEKFRESYIHLKNALQENPEHLPSKLLIGRIFLIDGYPDAAITEFEEIVQAGADANLVVLPLANAYFMNRQLDKLVALEIPPNANQATQLEMYLLKANAQIQLGNYSQAESQFQNAKEKFGEDIRLVNGKAQLALLKKDYAKAENIIKQALKLSPSNAQSHLLNGLIKQAQKQYNRASKAFELAYNYAPEDPAIMRALANSYARAGSLVKANELVNKIERQSPDELQTKLLRARLLAMSEKDQEADVILTELSQTLNLADKTDKKYRSNLSVIAGIIAHLNENHELSVRELRRYLENEEPSAEIVAMLAEGYVRTDEIKAATQLLEQHEMLILDNIQIASLSCDLYLSRNKIFKCDSLVQQLKQRHGEEDPDVLLLEAKILNRRNQPQRALDILQSNLVDNKSTDTVLFRATLLASIGRYQDALKDAEYLRNSNPDSVDYQLLNVDLFIRSEKFDQAKLLLDQLLAKDPDNLAGLIHQSRIYFASGDIQNAHRSIQKVLNVDKTNSSALLLHSQVLIKQQKLNDAIDQLLIAKTLNQTNVSPRELLISIYKQQNNLDLAINELNQLLKLRPAETEYIHQKAKIYITLNQSEKAKKEMDQLYFQWIEKPQKLVQLSSLQMANSDFKAAETSLIKAQQLAPNYLFAQLEYANLLLTQNKLEEVDIVIQKMKKKFLNNANVELVLGHYFKQSGNLEKAYQQYLKAYSMSENFNAALIELYKLAVKGFYLTDIISLFSLSIDAKPEAHFNRHLYADLLFLDGKKAKALIHYEKLILIDELPNKANIYNNLAEIYVDIDIDKAISYAQQAVNLNPSSSSILDTQGWLYSKNNNPKKGLSILRQAYTLNSDSPTIRYHLAYTLNKLGRKEEAKSELVLALQSTQSFLDRENAQELLSKLK